MMRNNPDAHTLQECLGALTEDELSPLDFLPDGSVAEKVISLVLTGPPQGLSARLAGLFQETLAQLGRQDTRGLKVVILGGGTGLSSIVGGDSRRPEWGESPFTGLKEIFPCIHSIVCVTDDGGSTGELLKVLPLIALGDLRHVLVSSIRRDRLQELYGLDDRGAAALAGQLHVIFNYRFAANPDSGRSLLQATGADLSRIPAPLLSFLQQQVDRLFEDVRLVPALAYPQCLGNLLLASSIFGHTDPGLTIEQFAADTQLLNDATLNGLESIGERIGTTRQAVLPCTTTSAQLQMLYANGVLVTGEYKSSRARRGYPVDRAVVEFCNTPFLPAEAGRVITDADILVYAPGSLYSSIIPVLQVPGLADMVRSNTTALKILVSNIWVQQGETDATRDAPERKFHVSDLIRAYNRNIPGGVRDLFSHVLTLGLREIPGSVLQSYALEDKQPIYLDRSRLREIGFEPVEAGIFSTEQLHRHHVVQHDPDSLALAIRTLWCLKSSQQNVDEMQPGVLAVPDSIAPALNQNCPHPCFRYNAVQSWLATVTTWMEDNGSDRQSPMSGEQRSLILKRIAEIVWHHPDILVDHLGFADSVVLVGMDHWLRSQQWDNIFSFYDPAQKAIIIREDQVDDPARFEMAFLVALGQSLLGNYALDKSMEDIQFRGENIGRVFRLTLRNPEECESFFNSSELATYLKLTRMRPSAHNSLLYTRLVNGEEGFTPPGLLFGLFYTWYLDNRFASHIEYKMSIMRNAITDLIPEQKRIVGRRENIVHFFREKVFRHPVLRNKTW